MKALLTVCFHSIYQVHAFIRQHYPDKRIWVSESGEKIKPCDVLLVPSASQFRRVKSMVSKKPVVVIVFDTPSNCVFLKPSIMVDAKQVVGYRFKNRDLTPALTRILDKVFIRGNKPFEFSIDKLDAIPHLLGETRPSLISPIMGWLYGIKDPVKRAEYQKLIFTAVSEGGLDTVLLKIGETEPKAMVKKLAVILDDEKTLRLSEVVQAVNILPKPLDYRKLAKIYTDVDMFDLTYLFKTYKRVKQYKKVDKTFDEIFNDSKITLESVEPDFEPID